MARLGLDASGNLLVNVAAGGAGGGAVTIADGDDVVEGALADAAVTTDIAGTVNAKLRGLVVIATAINTKLPSQGQAIAAASVPVVLPAAQISTLTPPAAITGFALETGGNLAGLNPKMPAQGEALAAASVPVVLTAAQVVTLTPQAAITGFALETGGNLASINTKLPPQGQALAAASVPVVLTAAQVVTLTPPAAITGFALETGGNLASINTKLPPQGQALAAASVPVVLTAAQVSTLTPPAAITGFALETGGNLAGLNTKMPAQGQALAAASVPVVLTAAQIITLTPPTSVTAAPSAATAGGATPYSYVAAAALNQDSTVVKNAAGQLYAIAALSTIAALRFLKVYDKASAPTSADTPVLRLPIPANASTGAGLVLPISVGVVFAG